MLLASVKEMVVYVKTLAYDRWAIDEERRSRVVRAPGLKSGDREFVPLWALAGFASWDS